jgi:hypothetical protein
MLSCRTSRRPSLGRTFYGAVLPVDVRNLLEQCLTLADIHDPHQLDVSPQANEAADQLHKNMKKAESIMLMQVRSQSIV